MSEDNLDIVGIELQNKLMIPVTSIKFDNKKHKKYTKSQNKLYFEINNALYKKDTPDVDIDFIKEKYDFEVYQRLLLEIGNFINHNSIYKHTIDQLLLDNKFENKPKLKDTIEEIIDSIVIYKEPETINYKKYLKYAVKKNIRELCNVKEDFFCGRDENNVSKIIIPLDKKNTFNGILIESLINNESLRSQILDNKVNRIIDVQNYIDDNKHVFVKKEPFI